MKSALGLKAHSGWAVLVALEADDADLHVVDRRRIELVEDGAGFEARQPYHAAEGLKPAEARALVKRCVRAARRLALPELQAAVKRSRAAQHPITACGVLVGEGMPDWSVEEILAVHFRMHKAEGELFREALVRAAEACNLKPVAIREKSLSARAADVLGKDAGATLEAIAGLGRFIGPPWGKDQKDAALAALIALKVT